MITVIVPVYNSSQTLKKCLDAVFSNKFEKFEIIVISDGSKDNSIDIAKNYNCKIIELKQNKGPAFARNTGANSASGDILLFVDSDVVVKEDILMHVNKAFNNKEVNIEFIANRRVKSLGFTAMFDRPANTNPLPWTQHWLSSSELQVSPQETEVESYVVGGIKQDVTDDTFKGFKL